MARITFQKRQKEMKRLEKARMKAERRAQRKLAKTSESEALAQPDETASVLDAPPDATPDPNQP